MVEDVERGEVDVEGVAKSFGVSLFLVGSGGRAIFLLVVGESWEEKKSRVSLERWRARQEEKEATAFFFFFCPSPLSVGIAPPSTRPTRVAPAASLS